MSDLPATSCAHCGLPVRTAPTRAGERVFCCYGCYVVSRIVGGGEETAHSWTLLRLGLGAFLAMDVMMIALLLYTGTVEPAAEGPLRWAMLAMAAPAMAILGYPFALGAAGEVRRGRLSLDTLIAIGSAAAFGVSVASVISGGGHVYFDTATMLLALVTFGKMIEASAKARAGKLLRSLETLLPARATRVEPGGPREIAIGDIRAGDVLAVRPGERFPADGRIVAGRTTIEEAAFTGEFAPRTASAGDAVLAGSVNAQGSVTMEAQRVGEELLLRRIVRMVEQARFNPSRSQRIAEKAAAVFVPVVLLLALAAGAAWLAAGQPARALMSALAVLVVACPCAMGIAAPLAAALAIARAGRSGVIVRGGEAMERIGQVQTMFFDKTGTLTAGRPVVRRVRCDDGMSADEMLRYLASLESASEHAVARAVLAEAGRRNLPTSQPTQVRVEPGSGISGHVDLGGRADIGGRMGIGGRAGFVAAGTAEFLRRQAQAESRATPNASFALGVRAPEAATDAAPDGPREAADGDTTIHVSLDGRLLGTVELADEVRPGAAAAVAALKARGIATVLLSGDSEGATRAVALQVGVELVESRRTPDEKIARIRSQAGTVAMVGDGVNDAPALAAADVGIALGAGSDLARHAGNVVLLGDRLDQIPWLVDLSRRTRRIMKQNLLWALGYNGVALAAAACGYLHPLIAAAAMVASSLTVLSNSLRINADR